MPGPGGPPAPHPGHLRAPHLPVPGSSWQRPCPLYPWHRRSHCRARRETTALTIPAQIRVHGPLDTEEARSLSPGLVRNLSLEATWTLQTCAPARAMLRTFSHVLPTLLQLGRLLGKFPLLKPRNSPCTLRGDVTRAAWGPPPGRAQAPSERSGQPRVPLSAPQQTASQEGQRQGGCPGGELPAQIPARERPVSAGGVPDRVRAAGTGEVVWLVPRGLLPSLPGAGPPRCSPGRGLLPRAHTASEAGFSFIGAIGNCLFNK